MRLDKAFITLTVALLGAISLPAQDQVSLTVGATMDIYRAGGYNDGSDGIAPAMFSFPASPWRTIAFPALSGAWACNSSPLYSADGATTSSPSCYNVSNITGPVGSFSGFQGTDFGGALVGMFLGGTLPGSAPASLRFYFSNSSQGGIQTDFLTLSPKIGQVFFIGDGLTGTGIGTVQTFVVPAGASHLYLGYIDSCTQTTAGVPGCFTGNAGSLNVTARVQYYFPDWYEPTLSAAPSARDGASIAYDAATYSTVLFGGSSAYSGSNYNDTWAWRYGWYQLSPATSPSPRGGAGMAYDPTTGTVVLFGGVNNVSGAHFGDTWLWSGVTWTQQFPPVSPPARDAYLGMVYDAATETVLMFGGASSSAALGDTWEWNGRTKTWTQLTPATSPPPRASGSLAYDPITKMVVLFGGENGNDLGYNDTWTWDGTNWTQQHPATSPPGRTDAPAAYDPSLGEVVLFGGTNNPPFALNDTWGWNGTTWNQLSFYNQPPQTYVASMDYDALSGGLVLFGGIFTGNANSNDTWLLVPVPLP
jgi:Galactose oxidase, central domain